jgi:prepilin-type N-terminal cleavage/methylation domain-containing protein
LHLLKPDLSFTESKSGQRGMSHIMTERRNQRGLTLIEIMIVIAIMVIVSVISIPSYNRMSAHNRLNAAARTLLADIRGTREQAIKEGWQYGILVNDAKQYQIIRSTMPTFIQAVVSGGDVFTVVATKSFTSSSLGDLGVSMTVPVNLPVFQRNGAVSSWNSGTDTYSNGTAPDPVQLTNSVGETRTVSTNLMGYAQIQ